MSKDPFKTRLEIAKKKAFNSKNEKNLSSSPLGSAFKLSTELKSRANWGWIMFFIV